MEDGFWAFYTACIWCSTTARPSRGHAALAHWTPSGWCVNLGVDGGWMDQYQYDKDVDFLASSQGRNNPKAYLQVKRAQ